MSGCREREYSVTFSDLLDEMTDLSRLASIPDISYRTVQFSSYDRRSRTPGDSLWFANEDGFGGEPVPGFEKVLKQPDSTGTGEYLILDIRQPGVIQRLWTASITGKIKLFLDNDDNPAYFGDADYFFRKPVEAITGIRDSSDAYSFLRQFDATYLPVSFSRSCRIEWAGNIAEPHFYHVGLRIYDRDENVEPFTADALERNSGRLAGIGRLLSHPDSLPGAAGSAKKSSISLAPGETGVIFSSDSEGAIARFGIGVNSKEIENCLRQNILSIYFDDSESPQVLSPLGDFFGAAPGLNPFQSLPFTVTPDTNMVCRFLMPYRKSVRIEIRNLSSEPVSISSEIITRESKWIEGKTMYFRTAWKMAHNLTAFNTDGTVYDMDYLDFKGTGRLVGAATYIYNPSPVPTSWGNWWGEGDEKIFIDNDTFPSFFGTGSEDYYNYSWSSPRIFYYAYCAQPRNDGPGNRGYVSNLRCHITDDIFFGSSLSFKMELRHHGIVPGFSYGSITYFYALPSQGQVSHEIDTCDISDIRYSAWKPLAYLGCAGFRFLEAEDLAKGESFTRVEEGGFPAGGKILKWKPGSGRNEMTLLIQSELPDHESRLGLTLEHSPSGPVVSFSFNGEKIKFDNKDSLNLRMENRTVLDNHFSSKIMLKKGYNMLTVKSEGAAPGSEAGIDFVWLKTPDIK